MRVSLSLEMCFEKEGRAGFGLHRHRAGRRKPFVEGRRPCSKNHIGRSEHPAFDDELDGSRSQIGIQGHLCQR